MVTLLVVVLSIVSMVLMIIGAIRNKGKYKSLAVFAAAALLCMFIGAIGTGLVPPAYFGVVERFSTYSAVTFTALLGIYGFSFAK